MTAAELASDLEARADFVDRDRYDECMEIKETPEGRLLRQAAARLRAMEEALKPFAEAQLLSQSAVIVAGDGITQAFDSGKKHVTCLMEEDGGTAFNRARAALSGEGQ